jgi:hypothetical protein
VGVHFQWKITGDGAWLINTPSRPRNEKSPFPCRSFLTKMQQASPTRPQRLLEVAEFEKHQIWPYQKQIPFTRLILCSQVDKITEDFFFFLFLFLFARIGAYQFPHACALLSPPSVVPPARVASSMQLDPDRSSFRQRADSWVHPRL